MSTEVLSQEAKSEQFLVFLLEGEHYGFPILKIDGIINIPKITPIPKTPDFVKGVINLRGQIIPIIDMRLILKMPEIEYNEQTCIVILKINIHNSDKLVGFAVDVVSEVFDIPVSEIEPPPNYGGETDESYLKGIGKARDKIIMLLNIDEILSTKEAASFLSNNFDELSTK